MDPSGLVPITWDELGRIETVLSLMGIVVGITVTIVGWLKGWWRRLFHLVAMRAAASTAVVFRGRQILLVERAPNSEGLRWQFPTGTIKPKDEPASRAIATVLEETGVRCEVTHKIGQRVHPQTRIYLHYFACQYRDGTASNLDPSENAQVKWASISDAQDLLGPNLYGKVREFLKTL